jgi:hypothetical protein
MKSECSFQTNHNSFSCTHVKFSNLVLRDRQISTKSTCFVKLTVFTGKKTTNSISICRIVKSTYTIFCGSNDLYWRTRKYKRFLGNTDLRLVQINLGLLKASVHHGNYYNLLTYSMEQSPS